MKSSIVLCYGINKLTYLRILSTCYIMYYVKATTAYGTVACMCV